MASGKRAGDTVYSLSVDLKFRRVKAECVGVLRSDVMPEAVCSVLRRQHREMVAVDETRDGATVQEPCTTTVRRPASMVQSRTAHLRGNDRGQPRICGRMWTVVSLSHAETRR